MKPLYIFRHIRCEGPGYLADVLALLGIPFRIVAVDQDAAIPEHTRDCSGLVFMGGPMSVNDPLPWIGQELALIREGFENELPILGHCLGGQLISKALGGEVTANAVREIGWHPVRKAGAAADSDWLAGLPGEMELFHWHSETFSLPGDAEVLLESEYCPHQAFTIGNTLALQCHVEMTAPMVKEWTALYSEELDPPSRSVQGAAQMTADLDKRISGLQQVADRLYRRWLKPLNA